MKSNITLKLNDSDLDQLAEYVSENIDALKSEDDRKKNIKNSEQINNVLESLKIINDDDKERFYDILLNTIDTIIEEEKKRQGNIQKITGVSIGVLIVCAIIGTALAVAGVVALPVGLSIAAAGVIGAGASFIIGTNFAKKNNITKENFRDFNDNKLPKLLEEIEGKKKNLLFEACIKGDESKVRELLNEGVGVNITYNSYTPLHVACLNGHADVVKVLLLHNADTYAEDKKGYTPIRYACMKGYSAVFNLFKKDRILRFLTKERKDKNGNNLVHRLFSMFYPYDETIKALKCIMRCNKLTNDDIISLLYDKENSRILSPMEMFPFSIKIFINEENKVVMDIQISELAIFIKYLLEIRGVNKLKLAIETLEKNNEREFLEPFLQLCNACEMGSIDELNNLLKKGNDIIKNLAAKGIDINKNYKECFDYILFVACINGHKELFNLFDRERILNFLKQGIGYNGNNFVHRLCSMSYPYNKTKEALKCIIQCDKLTNDDIISMFCNILNRKKKSPAMLLYNAIVMHSKKGNLETKDLSKLIVTLFKDRGIEQPYYMNNSPSEGFVNKTTTRNYNKDKSLG